MLDTRTDRTPARSGALNPMTVLPVTYGYARVSKPDDAAGDLNTQLRLLTNQGIYPELVFSDVTSGRTMNRLAGRELMTRSQPGDTIMVAFLDRFAIYFWEFHRR